MVVALLTIAAGPRTPHVDGRASGDAEPAARRHELLWPPDGGAQRRTPGSAQPHAADRPSTEN
ncbi:MAG: hypothetical protein DI576_14280 [Actinomyces sp.]|nr:MAG: hypothetical protein DI576_14280 [Actinomyces sp.]